MNKYNESENEKANELLGLEFNVVTFLAPIITVVIFSLSRNDDIFNIITTALTFSFTAYMFKLSRTYEIENADNKRFLNTLIAPRKNEMGQYLLLVSVILIIILSAVTVALVIFYGFNLNNSPTILARILGGYYVSLAFLASGYLSMLIIFDLIITLVLFKKK